MAKKTSTGSSGQVIAENQEWRLSAYVDRGGFGIHTWILKKRLTDEGMESGWVKPYQTEKEAFDAAGERGLLIEVRGAT